MNASITSAGAGRAIRYPCASLHPHWVAKSSASVVSTPSMQDSSSRLRAIPISALTIIALSRGRGEGDGILHVTGRDVIEAGYAVTFRGGAWALAGDDLDPR